MKLTVFFSRPNRFLAAISVVVSILLPAMGRADTNTVLQLGVAPPGSANEVTSAFLTWPAGPGNYLVQSSTDLSDPAAWTTEDVVSQTTVGPLKWMAPEALQFQKFYRLILPQPQIFSVEPAVISPGAPVDLYITGQGLGTNLALLVNGVLQTNVVFSSSTSAVAPAFTPDVPGTYELRLVSGGIAGIVVASCTVLCADPLVSPELVLQGPPSTEPPAAPNAKPKPRVVQSLSMNFTKICYRTAGGGAGGAGGLGGGNGGLNLLATYLSKRGYDYYKAQSEISDYSFDIEQTLGIGSQSSGAGTGKITFNPFSITRKIDMASPMLDQRSGGGGAGAGKVTFNPFSITRFADPADDGDCDDGDPECTLLMPALMKAKEKANQTKCGSGLRLQPSSGEVQDCDVDLAVPGRGLDFVWARSYHSRIGRFGTATNGWTFSYDVRCAQNSVGGMDVYDGTGRKDTFTPGTNGVYSCPEIFREGTLSNNTFTLTYADTGRWVFNPFDGTAAAGKLIQIITRNGDIMTLRYDTGGRLAQIVDDLGRTNTVAYNTAGQLASVTDFSGRMVTYQYYQGAKSDNGSAGDLQSVTSPPVVGTPNGNDFPAGKTTTYTYSKSFPLDRENHLLLTVTDPKGQTAAVFSYEHSSTSGNYLRCIAAQEGTNTACCFSWTLVQRPAGSSATLKCIANDPVGNVTECFYDARNRCVIEHDFTGRATPGLPVTDTLNRPAGQLRSTDPVYFETLWSWNSDSLCTLASPPGGQQMQYVYQSDFDPATPARKRADCRVLRELASSPVDLNGDGIPDVISRASYYSYDPRFGSDPVSSRSWDGNIKGVTLGHGDENPTESIRWSGGGEELPKESLSLALIGSGMAINKKGTGADNNRIRPRGWDGTVKAVSSGPGDENPTESLGVAFAGNGMAIKTKGTGADHNRIRPRGWDGTIKGVVDNSAGFEDLWPSDGNLDFNDQATAYNAISVTDPRGNGVTASLDAQGNCLRMRKRPELLYQAAQPTELDFAYDTHGQLIAVTNAADANGRSRVDTFTWSQGRITNCVVDAGGLALTAAYEYDPRGNVTRGIDPRTNDWLFVYNSLDQLVQSSSALVTANGSLSTFRTTSQFAYDANDNLVQSATELRDATGTLQGIRADNYRYDGLDRLSEVALAVDAGHALTNRYAYDGNDECVQVLGGDAVSGADPHQMLTDEYDERGLLFHATAAPGSPLASTNEYDYTPNGKIRRFNCDLYVETMAFDGFDRLAAVTDPMGNQTVCFYDANDNPKVVRQLGELHDVPGSAGNVRLAESHYEYDNLDRCVRAHDLFFDPATQSPLGGGEALTTCAYAPNDECVSVMDTLGHTTTYGYDTACRAVSVRDALGNAASVVYDAGENPLAETSSEMPAVGGKPQVFSVTNVYDALNRCVSVTDSAGNTSTCAYDSLGRCVQTVDPRGTLAFYSYDLLDRCTVAIGDLDRDGLPDFTSDITSTFTWSSSSGDLLATTDSNTNSTSYAYDSLGRCVAITCADGTQELMSWDPHGNLFSQQDANGTTITNTYDLSDRIVHRDIACRNVLATTTFENYAYDGCDRLTGATNDAGGTAFVYDSHGDGVSETLNGLATTSIYDALGNRLSLTYPGGRALSYTYDALNRCATITDSGVQLATYAYDGPDRVSAITYGNGTRTQIAYDGMASPPNASGDYGFGQVRRVRHGVVASGVTIDDRTFTYDPDQNKLTRDLTQPFTLGGAALAESFQYDPACRLITSLVTSNGTVSRLVSYGLDRMGNRTTVTGAACSGGYTMSSTLPPGDFQMNQYTTTPCDSRTYDDDGNLTSAGSSASAWTYQYDYAGRLVQVQALDSGLGTLAPVASYAYDALGRRISKTVFAGGLPPATTQFLYDGGSVIEERNGTTTTATYVRDGQETDVDCGGPCLAMRRASVDYYFHTDDQGNTLALTTTGGAVVERYDYDDYGAVTFLTSDGFPTSATASAVGNVYCWGGLRLDAETGLHNNDGGGYFEPQTGRELMGKRQHPPLLAAGSSCGMTGNNPWSGPPVPMQKGTVKFFNDAKGFGRAAAQGIMQLKRACLFNLGLKG